MALKVLSKYHHKIEQKHYKTLRVSQAYTLGFAQAKRQEDTLLWLHEGFHFLNRLFPVKNDQQIKIFRYSHA